RRREAPRSAASARGPRAAGGRAEVSCGGSDRFHKGADFARRIEVERAGGGVAAGIDGDPAERRLDRGDGGGGDGQLVHPEPDEERRSGGDGGEAAARADRSAVAPSRFGSGADQAED